LPMAVVLITPIGFKTIFCLEDMVLSTQRLNPRETI
jgi:hypothetical protein